MPPVHAPRRCRVFYRALRRRRLGFDYSLAAWSMASALVRPTARGADFEAAFAEARSADSAPPAPGRLGAPPGAMA